MQNLNQIHWFLWALLYVSFSKSNIVYCCCFQFSSINHLTVSKTWMFRWFVPCFLCFFIDTYMCLKLNHVYVVHKIKVVHFNCTEIE